MRQFVIILLFLPIALHGQMNKNRTIPTFQADYLNGNKFQLDSFGFHGQKHLDTLFYDNMQIKAIGYYAVDKQGNKSYHRVGLWTEFYRNGQIMSIGNYDLQFFIGCYNTMPGIRYYSFKKGDWAYFYENGQMKAKGIYKIDRVTISTGVANQFENRSLTTPDWIVKDDTGQTAKERQKVISDLEGLHL